MYSVEYVTYTTSLIIFPILNLLLIILQLFANKYGDKIKDNSAKILLYAVYISAFLCSCFGFSLHAEPNPLWCKLYGLPPCFSMLGATKGFLYAFFLRRAKKAHAGNICIESKMYKKLLFDWIGPLYIFIYWVVYVIAAYAVFSGKPVAKSTNGFVSRCMVDSWKWWFVILADVVDFFNSIATLVLFLLPLLISVRKLETDDTVNNRLLPKFITCMKWNVVLSFIATISSVINLIAIPLVGGYIWLFCGGDPFVNSVCVFLMMATNRKFIKDKCGIFQSPHSVESELELQSKSTKTKGVSYDMDGIDIVPDIGSLGKCTSASDQGVASEFSRSCD